MFRCYSARHWQRYLNEPLPEALQQAMTQHLATCEACQEQLEQLTSGVLPEVKEYAAATQALGDSSSEDLSFLAKVKELGEDLVTPNLRAPVEGAAASSADPAEQASSLARQPAPIGPTPGYEIVEVLGRGGMGVVYRARQLGLNRLVALKMIVGGGQANAADLARFRAEAEALAVLKHPNIVQVYDIGEMNGQPFFSMELVTGGTLAQLLEAGPLPARAAAELIATLAAAVHGAHQHGIIHRDLKPSNVLLQIADCRLQIDKQLLPDSKSAIANPQSAIPKIADFGLARRLDTESGQTLSGTILGTPSYLAPEMASGMRHLGGTLSDVYALGAILYECLTGRPPFRGETVADTILLLRETEPASPRRLQPGLDRELETICLKCLRKNPTERYGGAQALADDLGRYLRGEPVQARPASTAERLRKWARRRPALAALVLLILMVVGLGGPGITILWLQADSARHQAEAEREKTEALLYASRINLADHAYQAYDLPATIELLEKCRPRPGRPDLRGWEWNYLNRLCHVDLFPGMSHAEGRDSWNWVHALAFRPDGRQLVSAGGWPEGNIGSRIWPALKDPGDCKVWNVPSGQCLATLRGHAGAVWAVAASADGKSLASGSADGSVCLWEGDGHVRKMILPPQTESVRQLVFSRPSPLSPRPSPDDLLLVRYAKSVVVWDVAAAATTFRRPVGPHEFVLGLSANQQALLVLNNLTGTIKVLDLRSGREIEQLSVPPKIISEGVYICDGRLLTVADGNKIQIWDLNAKVIRQRLAGHANSVTCLAFGPKGTLASGGDDQVVRLWDTRSGKELAVYRGHEYGITALAFSPDGRRLASGGKDEAVKLWDLGRQAHGIGFEVTAKPRLGEFLANLAFAGDDPRLLVVHQENDFILGAYDTAGGKLLSRHTLSVKCPPQPYREFIFSGDGRYLTGLDTVGHESLITWDALGRELSRSSLQGPATAFALSHDGGQLAHTAFLPAPAGMNDGRMDVPVRSPAPALVLSETATGKEVHHLTLPSNYRPTLLAFSRDGRFLAMAGRPANADAPQPPPEAAVFLWDSTVPDKLKPLAGKEVERTSALAFHPGSRRLAVATFDQTIRLWDLDSGTLCYEPLRTSMPLTGLTFSPDGRRLAGTGPDSLVRLWDADTGNDLLILRGFEPPGTGHYGFTARVAFSPDGNRLAANSWFGTVNVWDAGPYR